jgi:cellulose synthase/poly-beta-1,6-N-acetylglucosamine synthase-like glycosyltransferase
VSDDLLPKVSVVITSRNNEETIGECVKSIVQLDYPTGNLEILLIDANSTDKTAQIAADSGAKVISLSGNAPAAYNYALKVANFDILAFVDSDAKVERDWLKKLVPHLDEPKTAGVSGNIETWNSENPWARSIGYDIKTRYARISEFTGRVATMNLLLKRSVLEELGGFDEKFPSQYDTELGFRLSQKGYRIAFERNAVCYHFNRPTLSAYWRQQKQYGKNTVRLYFKYSGLAKGDEITDFGMNIQPILILVVIGCFLLGFIELLRALWYVAGLILLLMFLYFVFSAARTAAHFHDGSAMRLFVLYYVRSFAWLAGAAVTAVNVLRGRL